VIESECFGSGERGREPDALPGRAGDAPLLAVGGRVLERAPEVDAGEVEGERTTIREDKLVLYVGSTARSQPAHGAPLP